MQREGWRQRETGRWRVKHKGTVISKLFYLDVKKYYKDYLPDVNYFKHHNMAEYISMNQNSNRPNDNKTPVPSHKIQAFVEIESDIISLSNSDSSIWPSSHILCFHGNTITRSENLKELSDDGSENDLNKKAGIRSITPAIAAVLGFCTKDKSVAEVMSKVLEQNIIDIYSVDKDGLNALHYAAYFGNVAAMKIILSRCNSYRINGLLNSQDNRHKITPLILAFYSYSDRKHASLESVTDWFLNQEDTDILLADKHGFNALYCACILRKQRVISKILNSSSATERLHMIGARAQNGTTCLSYMASKLDKKASELLVSFLPHNLFEVQSEGRDSTLLTSLHYGQKESTINVLIKYLPDVLIQLLDKSIIIESKILERDCISVEFSYLEPYIGNKYNPYVYRYGNCPLDSIARYKVHSLLSHPTVGYLIKRKWESLEYSVYLYIQLFYFLLFMAMLLVYESEQLRPEIAFERNCTSTGTVTGECSKTRLCLASGYFVFIQSIIRLFLELLDLLHAVGTQLNAVKDKNKPTSKRKSSISAGVYRIKRNRIIKYILAAAKGFAKYFISGENILQIFLFSTAAVFSFNVTQPHPISSDAWQTGAFCVFLSFVHLLFLIRPVMIIGFHVTMFIQITRNFLKSISVLLAGLILAFLLIFHMLLGHHPFWKKIVTFRAVYRVILLGAEGIELAGLSEDEIYYHAATACGVVAFSILVQVMFLNLATGLALNDVQDARKYAEVKRKLIKIKTICHIEEVFKKLQMVLQYVPCLRRRFNIFKNQKRIFREEEVKFVQGSNIIAWQERVSNDSNKEID